MLAVRIVGEGLSSGKTIKYMRIITPVLQMMVLAFVAAFCLVLWQANDTANANATSTKASLQHSMETGDNARSTSVYRTPARQPLPTDIVNRLENKSERKEWRKQWFDDRNKSAKGYWKDIEQQQREANMERLLADRKRAYEMGTLRTTGEEETFADGAFEGVWYERGSRNVAGRMHLCELVEETGVLYSGSNGGNVWKSNLEGNDWTNLNDFLQFSNIHSLRHLQTEAGYGCSQVWKDYITCVATGGTYDAATGTCSGGGVTGDDCEPFSTGVAAQGPCNEGFLMDCAGNCVEVAQFTNWIGDGYCDDGTYGTVFTCLEFNNDGGDCGVVNGCSSAWTNYSLCLEEGGEYDLATGLCSTIADLLCSSLLGGEAADFQGGCAEGEIMDCDGNCFPVSALDQVGDGNCDQGGDNMPNFMCDQYENDGGDVCPLKDRLIVATPSTLYYTENEGVTWDIATGLENGSLVRMIIADGAPEQRITYALMAAAGAHHLYRSYSDAASFELIHSFATNNGDLWADRYDPQGRLYVVNDNQLFVLLPGEDTPTAIAELPIVESGYTLLTGTTLSITDQPVYLYAHVGTHIYASEAGDGTDWEFKGDRPEGPFARNSFHCQLAAPGTLYFGGVNAHKSTDSGENWEPVNTWGEYYGDTEGKLHADVNGFNSFQTPEGIVSLVCTDGGTYTSTDNLETVKNITLTGIGTSQYYSQYSCKFDTRAMYTGSQDQGFQRTLIDTEGIEPLDFQQTISGDYGSISSSDDGASLWTVYPGFLMHYSDILNSTAADFWDFVGDGWNWMAPTLADPLNPHACYVGGGDDIPGQYLWYAEKDFENGGLVVTKMPFNFSPDDGTRINYIAASPIDPNYMYVTTGWGQFFLSTDKGETWEEVWDLEDNLSGNVIVPSPTTLGEVYLAGSGYSNPACYFSDDHGYTMTELSTGLPATSINHMSITPEEDMLFAATNAGPYVYVFEDATWYFTGGQNAPTQNYTWTEYLPQTGTARFSTYGRGVLDLQLSCRAAPAEVEVVYSTAASTYIDWKNVAGVENYIVQYRIEGSTEWEEILVSDSWASLEGLAPSSTYEVQVLTNCGEGLESPTSEIVSFNTFCASSGLASQSLFIDEVVIDDFSVASANDEGYAAFIEDTIQLMMDLPHSLNMSASGTSENAATWHVWIDLNKDNAFSEEELWLTAANDATTTNIEVAQLPDEWEEVTTIMRISLREDLSGATIDPCADFAIGEVEDYVVKLHRYCHSQGNDANYEWIEEVSIGDFSHTSGLNDGYIDFSDQEELIVPICVDCEDPIEVGLSPGFGGNTYNEYWRIWIDLNVDGYFTSDEMVFDAEEVSSETTLGVLDLPEGLQGGVVTRMRVAMHWESPTGPCDVFDYGEVEDYLVSFYEQGVIIGQDELLEEATTKAIGLNVYPNPVEGTQAKVLLHHLEAGEAALSVYQLDGRLLSKQRLTIGQTQETLAHDLSVNEFPSGVYIVSVEQEGYRASVRLIKQ